jgi:hypothetical protein
VIDPLSTHYQDLLREFLRANVEFLLIGGLAMAAHGHQRATKDLDLFVRATPENSTRIYRALASFGADVRELTPTDFADPEGTIFQVGVVFGARIDVTSKIDGVDFEEAKNGSFDVSVGDMRIPVIGLAPLVKNKLASGRPQDLIDVDTLEKALGAPRR